MNSNPPLTIDFTDFGNAFPKANNFFVNLLRQRFNVEVTDDPDFLFYSHNANIHRLYTCKKIYWTSEVYRPNWKECDYALTHHYIADSRHYRLPLYALWVEPSDLIKSPKEEVQWLARKTKFCCFVSSYINRKTEHRARFFDLLSRYKRVDAAGKALNNLGYEIPRDPQAKLEFMHPYRFYMAFENESVPGYTTEKIVEAMRARCIPIYWGNPRVVEEFNPASFINANDFSSLEALAKRVEEVDRSAALYLEHLRQPFFRDNRPNESFDRDRLLDYFSRIVEDRTAAVAARRRLFGRWLLTKRNPPHRIRYHHGSKPGPVAPTAGANAVPKP